MSKDEALRMALEALGQLWLLSDEAAVIANPAIAAIKQAHDERDIRNATLDEIADKIALMPFGDTAASFAVWIKEQKT